MSDEQISPAQSPRDLDAAAGKAGTITSVGTEGRQAVVALAGEIDLAIAPAILDTVNELLVEGRRHVLVNLDAVTFMDASALDALVAAHKRAAASGGILQLTAHPLCARLLEITGLVDLFSIWTA